MNYNQLMNLGNWLKKEVARWCEGVFKDLDLPLLTLASNFHFQPSREALVLL